MQLRDELAARALQLCGGTIFAGLHRGADALDETIAACAPEARVVTALGARHTVEPHIPLPIAARTAGYLRGCGLGPVRRRPC